MVLDFEFTLAKVVKKVTAQHITHGLRYASFGNVVNYGNVSKIHAADRCTPAHPTSIHTHLTTRPPAPLMPPTCSRGLLTRNIANMDIQYKIEDAPEFIPTVAWSGLWTMSSCSNMQVPTIFDL